MPITQRYEPAFPLSDLIEHPDNPRHGDEAAIDESMAAHGFYGAVLAQASTNQIIAGNHRARVARRRGESSVPVLFLDVDDDQARRLLLVDNRTNDTATYDNTELVRLLGEIDRTEIGLAGTGYEDDDLALLLAQLETPAADEEPSTEWDAPAHTRSGDLWLLGEHRLVCGDCRDPEVVASALDGGTINIAFTSPPYADRRKYDESSGFVPISPDDYVEWFEPVAANVAAHLAPDGSWFVNIKPGVTPDGLDTETYVLDLVLTHRRRWGWHWATEFCWERIGTPGRYTRRFKNGFEPIYQFTRNDWKTRPQAVSTPSDDVPQPYHLGHVGRMNVRGRRGGSPLDERRQGQGRNAPQINEFIGSGWALPSNRLPTFMTSHESTGHAAAFPVGLPAWFCRAYSDPGDLVYDPFGGSGSTLLAAHETLRRGVTVELSPAYCDTICLRFERTTGIAPVRDGTPVSFLT